MSRDYHAKRLAREQGIPYTEALRRVRSRDVTGQFESSDSPSGDHQESAPNVIKAGTDA